MFSVEELNQVMRLDGVHHKVAHWSPMHLQLCEINDFDAWNINNFPNYQEYLTNFAAQGLAYTGIGDGIIYAMFGVYEFWPGCAEAWLIPSKHIDRKTIAFHRASLAFFEHVAAKRGIKRLQFTVHTANVHADRWARRCYFEPEGLLRHYGPDGADYKMYARIF